MIEAGVLGLRLSPIATGFWRQADAKLKAQKASNAEVKVEADIKKASAQIAGFRMREQANAINLRVKVDEQSIRTANDKIRYIEHTWKQSDIKRAVRVQVFVAGAAALPALTQGIVSVTAAMTELSRVSLALPGLLAGVGAAAASLFTGLNGVGAAFKASNDGMQKSSQYARQYAQASRELENAQRDVVKALKDANREIEDQKTKLARGQLSVEQAALNVRRANEAVFKGGFQSITEYQQALLDVKSANLDLSEAVKQNSRNINDYYESAGRGAAQSDNYKDSLDRLSNSLDSFRKAQFQAAGMSEQFISAMENLAPAGQDFVLQVLKMKGAWQGLQNSVQTSLFKGLGDEITNLANRQLPVLKTGMQQVAAAINNDFKALARTLSRDASTKSIANIFQNTGQAINAATPGLDSFTSGLLKLSEVGTRFLPRVALAFNKVMGRFEAFINKADQDGSLNRWIDSGLKLVASLGRSLLSIGSILNSITEAYNKATGNVGGFASTMERALSGLAKSLASPEGQGQLIKWIRSSREFMETISEALPGIRKIFAAIGEGARGFAAVFFPIFSSIGNTIGGANGPLKTFVSGMLIWRTIVPLVNGMGKAWRYLNAQFQQFTEKRAALLSSRTAAWKAAFDADGIKFAAQTRLRALNDEVKETDRLYTRMFNSRAAAELEFTKAQQRRQALEGTAKSSKKAAKKDGLDEAEAKRRRGIYLADANAFKQAKAVEKKALEEFNIRDERLYKAAADRSRLRRDLEVSRPRAYRDLREATNLATKAQENFNKVNRLTADGMSGKWARSVALMKGKYDGLKSAMGFIGGVGASAGLAVGVAVAFDQLTAAQDRNRASADNLKESQDALAQTLSKGTGSATAATLEENARQLRDRSNPVHPDDPGQNFDAAKILEGQLGMSLAEAVNLTLPTEVKKREARLATADAQVIAAVPGLDEWKRWGKDFEKNGVNSSVYGKALNGDPGSIGKVEAAREAIRYENTPGLKLGAAVAIKSAPNDLGAAQEQLDRSGPYGGLRGLSLATGAARSIGNESLARSQDARESANVIPQRGLNSLGSSTFGKFTLGPNGAIINPDGSAVVEVESYPGEAWIQAQADKGISVERRFPNGAVITISPEFGRQYFNSYARGGPVWGAGSATSDSIPAMLSNGEFVINAKSASLIGHDRLQQMNSMKFANGGLVRGYAPGGPVLPLNPPPDDGGSSDVVGAILGGNNGPASIDPFNPGGIYGNAPTPVSPPVRTDPVNSAPVVRPYVPPPPAISQFGSIANGIDYIPRLGGSGALPDYGTTGLSAVDKSPINPDANILDYLVQVSNAYGLKPGSGPPDTELGNRVATELGIWNHGPMDGAQHDVHRALDMGTAEQSQAGKITDFVKSWMADPGKVAATRQLIYRDPRTGESFGIINGRALFGDELQKVYGADFPGHTKHVHLALEGVPLSAFKPNLPTASIPKLGDTPKATGVPQSPVAISPGPAASTPKGGVQLSTPGAIKGPFGDIPFDPISILKQIGAAILNGIFAFFGVDGSGFVNALFGLGGQQGLGIGKQVEEIPQADPDLVAGLDAQIAQYEALGTPAGTAMAEKIKAGRDDYLKQFDSVNAAASAESAAAYFDSIGQPDTASKLRAGIEALGPNPNEPNPERFGPVTTVPGTGEKGPTVLPRSGVFVAPAANYSGGTPETHNAIYRAFKEAGYPDSEWPSLVELLNHENDTYDPTRPTGGPNSDASGIFQFLSTTWDEVGMQYSTDPYIQSVAGMRYIKKRYGTPTAAWNFWQNPNPPGPDPNWPHWYSTGGMVALARGGMVSGPGTGTSDSIPAMLSNGEFVMRADAVKHWGSDKLHAMNRYADGGLVGYAPGGLVIPSDPEQQKSMLRDAFKPRSDDPNMQGGGGSFDSAPKLSTAQSIGQNIGNFGKGFAQAADQLVTGLAPLVGAGNLLNDAVRLESQLLGRPDQSIKDYKAPGVADSWKGMASAIAPLVGAGNVVNNALGIKAAPAAGVGDSWEALAKATSRYDQWTGGQKAEALGGNVFDILTAVLPGGAVFKANQVGQLGVKGAVAATSVPRASSITRAASQAVGAIVPGAGLAGRGVAGGVMAAKQAAWVRKNTRGIDFSDLVAPRAARKEIIKSIAELQAVAPTNLHRVYTDPGISHGTGLTLAHTGLEMKASTGDVGGAIGINVNAFDSPNTLTRLFSRYQSAKNPDRAFHPSTGTKGGIFQVIAHEYGHVLDQLNLGARTSVPMQLVDDYPGFKTAGPSKDPHGVTYSRSRRIGYDEQNNFGDNEPRLSQMDAFDLFADQKMLSYGADRYTYTGKKALTDFRYRELLGERFREEFDTVTQNRAEALGTPDRYNSFEFGKFIRSRLSGYSYVKGADLEVLTGLSGGTLKKIQKAMADYQSIGSVGFSQTQLQDLITASVLDAPDSNINIALSNLFNRELVNGPPRSREPDGLYGSPAQWALRTIDRHESIAEAFADVMTNGARASRGSKTVYNILQEQLAARGAKIPEIDKADYSDVTTRTQGFVGQGIFNSAGSEVIQEIFKTYTRDPLLSESNAKTNAEAARARLGLKSEDDALARMRKLRDAGIKFWDAKKGKRQKSELPSGPMAMSDPPVQGRGLAKSWESAVKQAQENYDFEVEEAQQWNPFRTGKDAYDPDGNPNDGRRANLPLGSPFNWDQLTTLLGYSGSSSVNKSLRGMDQLPLMTRILQELLAIRPNMTGYGGRPQVYNPGTLLKYMGDNKDMPSGAMIESLMREFPGNSSQQYWELLLTQNLAAARLRAARLLDNLNTIQFLDSAFGEVSPLAQDMWVTRFVDDLGPDFDLEDPESLVGKTVPNVGYSSTSVGITSKPGTSPLQWRHRSKDNRGSNPFQLRRIMKQMLVRAGTPAIWFGGTEGELLLPRGFDFSVLGQQDIRAAAGYGPEDMRYAAEVARKMEEMTGQAQPNKFKLYGTGSLNPELRETPTAADFGYAEIEPILRALSNGEWTKLLAPQGPMNFRPEYSDFRDMPGYLGLPFDNDGGIPKQASELPMDFGSMDFPDPPGGSLAGAAGDAMSMGDLYGPSPMDLSSLPDLSDEWKEVIAPRIEKWGARRMEESGRLYPRLDRLTEQEQSLISSPVLESGRTLYAISEMLGTTGEPSWWRNHLEYRFGAEFAEWFTPKLFGMMPGTDMMQYANGGYVSGRGGPKSDMIPAMLSNGEFVMSAAATDRIGAGRLMAMNKFANGGPVPPAPSGGSDPDAFKDLSKVMTTPLFKPAESGSSDPDAFKDLSAITPANIIGSALAPKGGGGGVSASAAAPKPKDPRAILGAAPRSDSYVNPALAGAIKGGFNTVGSIISTAASLAAAGSTSGASAAIPGGGAAAASLISAGTQMAGDVAVGAANILSAFLVGTVTPSQTGQGYGAPLLPQQQPGGGVNNFQSIHNGNVVTNNLSEYSRLKDRKDAQKAAPFFNRVNQ